MIHIFQMMRAVAPKSMRATRCVFLGAVGSMLACAHHPAPAQATSQPAQAAPVRDALVEQTPDPEVWRSLPPKTPALAPMTLPTPTRQTLANGLQIISVEKPALPLVHVSLVFRSGSAQDPNQKPGVAGFMADMLKMGTDKLSAKAISEKIESQGANLDIDVTRDAISLSVTVLKENLAPVLEILADMVLHPSFETKEMERMRKMRLSAIVQRYTDPSATARRVFNELAFASHPYAHDPLGTKQSTQHIARQDLKAFHQAYIRPSNMAVVAVGDLHADEAKAIFEKMFGFWQAPSYYANFADIPTTQPATVTLIPRAEAPQSQVLVGELGLPRNTEDFYPLVLCNAILGGLFNSRINMNLREDKGWTYGAFSGFDYLRASGTFFVRSGIRTDATEPAIREILKEIAQIRNTDVEPDELANAKNRYGLSLPGYFQNISSIADMMTNIYLYDLALDYYQTLPQHLEAVRASDVRRVATAHLHPEQMHVVVVGDPQQVKEPLERLGRGPIQMRDAQGFLLPQTSPTGPETSATATQK